jgi:hypothetical protein
VTVRSVRPVKVRLRVRSAVPVSMPMAAGESTVRPSCDTANDSVPLSFRVTWAAADGPPTVQVVAADAGVAYRIAAGTVSARAQSRAVDRSPSRIRMTSASY